MKKQSALFFIHSISEQEVECYFFDLNEFRTFPRWPLFTGLKLYRGKNMILHITIQPGEQIVKCVESKESILKQLWNYHIRGSFDWSDKP